MPDGVVAEAVVEVAVCAEQVRRLQVSFTDIVDNGFPLIVKVGAAVNDDGFGGLVANDVAVLL